MGTFTYESIAYRFKNPTIDGNLDLLDDGAIIKIAADDDLQLTHSGSVGDITCSTGALDINAGTVNIKDEASSETMASFVSDGAVTLNHDNTARFATASAGCEVTGTLSVSGTSAFTGAITSNNGVIVDNITIDGTEIDLSSGSLTLDIADSLIIDVDGSDILLKDGGTQFGAFRNTSGNLFIQSGSTTAATFSGANVTFAGTLASGAITSTGDITAFSDERLKTDIKTIESGLDKVSKMRGVTFKRDGKLNSGVIAQELEKIAPELVKTADDEMGTKSVAYGNMVAYLIEAVKELKVELENHKKNCHCKEE